MWCGRRRIMGETVTVGQCREELGGYERRKISHVSHLPPHPSLCQPCVAQLGGHLNFKSLLDSPKHEKETQKTSI